MMTQDRIAKVARLLFWYAVPFTLVTALLSHPPQLPTNLSDKVQHMVAFATLAGSTSVAYPRRQLRIGCGLILFGAAIEVLQTIPVLHRDGNALDWLADIIAAVVVLGAVQLYRARTAPR